MGDHTKIEWTDATWNPVRGCSRVSQGCVNCYAERVAHRFAGSGQPYEGLTNEHGRWNGTVRLVDEPAWSQPSRWRKPRRIFVNSMSDLFHESLHFEDIAQVYNVMALPECDKHTFQVLTKRPQRAVEFFDWAKTARRAQWPWNGDALDNVWLGVSVENQAAADERIPHLLNVPARVRFLSCEPLLGPVELSDVTGRADAVAQLGRKALDGIHWVIAGGESGPGARPMHPQWARSLRDQCTAAGVPFFFKQWGEWAPDDHVASERFTSSPATAHRLDGALMLRVGKACAGRVIDGQTWDEVPRG